MRETGLFLKTDEGTFTYRVGALIIKDNKILVAKSDEYPCFYTVGGVVEINETSAEAVIREVFEETGFKLDIDRLICIQERFLKVGTQNCHEIDLFYLMKDSKNFIVADNSYTDQAPKETLHWISISDLPKTNIVPESIKSLCFSNLSGIVHIISKE